MSNTEDPPHAGERLKVVRMRADLSQKQFADCLSLPLRTYQSYERGERTLPRAVIAKLAELSPVNPLWVLDGTEPMLFSDWSGRETDISRYFFAVPNFKRVVSEKKHEFVTIDVMGDETDQHETFKPSQSEYALWFHISFITDTLKMTVDDARLFVVQGDSMSPLLSDGDLVLLDTSESAPSGEGLFVVRIGKRLSVKRLQQMPEGWVRMISENPAYEPIDLRRDDIPSDVAVLGRVKWLSRVL